jgi:hypothetical protein
MSKVYLLQYDENNDGSRENWNVFYTPCEAFDDPDIREERIKYIKSIHPSIGFNKIDVDISLTHNFTIQI